MYPFERFTEDAKRVLTLAQEEAERSHHSYIGTEHLLLGIMRGKGTGHDALVELGIDAGRVRAVIASVLGRNERIIVEQTVPTSRVKKVIEISFEEARRMGHNFVSSGHLLTGLVIEGEGIAAHVLEDLGANKAAVVATVERLIRAQPSSGVETWTALEMESTRVVETGESSVEALARLLGHPHIANLLRARGLVDIEGLAASLGTPPDEVARLRAQLINLHHTEGDVRKRLDLAEQDWLRRLTD